MIYSCLSQYKKEHDGVVETRVQQKITVQTDGDPIDHDQVLAEAIQVIGFLNKQFKAIFLYFKM